MTTEKIIGCVQHDCPECRARQPEALRLAALIEHGNEDDTHEWDAAAELRRLHKVNSDLLDALETADARLIAAAPDLLEAFACNFSDLPVTKDRIERFYALACAMEREECAKFFEDHWRENWTDEQIVEAIRARGQA